MKHPGNPWSTRALRFALACLVQCGVQRAVADGGRGPSVPTVAITAPHDGAVLKVAPTTLEADARDPQGGPVTKLDFVANGVVVATSDRSGDVFPAITGLTVHHTAVWTNPPAGITTLLGRAVVRGTNVDSAPVAVSFGQPVRVTAFATDPVAGEGAPADTGTFRVTRSPFDASSPDLAVALKWGGTASNGVDYAALPDSVVIPAGKGSVDVTVTPLADALVEGPETVVLKVQAPAAVAGQPAPYYVGFGGDALVVIADLPSPKPLVRLVTPTNGAHFVTGDPIPLEAAVDNAANVKRVTFWSDLSDDRPLLVVTNPPYAGVWSNAPAGPHAVEAVALLSDGRLLHSGRVVLSVDRPAGQAATLAWTAPADGTSVQAGTPVGFAVTGTDPQGVIPQVNFYVDGKLVGSASAPTNAAKGDAVPYAFSWTPLVQVTRKLSARALTSDGLVLLADGPTITVTGPTNAPKVTVVATGAEVSEDDAAGRLTFRVERDGPTNTTLAVTYVLTGTATFGADYVPAKTAASGGGGSGEEDGDGDGDGDSVYRRLVTIPAGATSATVQFAPVADRKVEGDETVLFAVVPPSSRRGATPAYAVGDPSSAKGVIHDAAVPPAELPSISIVATTPETSEPTTNRFGAPAVLTLVRTGPTNRPVKVYYAVGGTAQNGRDYRFLDGDAVIPAGETRRDIQVVPAFDRTSEGDETVVLTLKTNRAYTLKDPSSATATIHEGVVSKAPSLVLTAPADGARYTNPAVVVLTADVTDPKGYVATVDFVADGAVVATSKLEFIQAPAPGTTLHHSATWTNPAVGVHHVSAAATSTDGTKLETAKVAVTVSPAPEPPPVVLHPADNAPADGTLTDAEEGLYAATWLAGAPFGSGPAPVPASYATRAGYLLKNGGAYHYDPSAGDLPLAWVSDVPAVPGPGTGAVSHAVAEVPEIVANTPIPVTIRIVPLDGVKAQAVEEVVGPGATVTDISDGGVYDAAAGVIRWGVYLDDTLRTVTATVTVPDVRAFTGLASFDGADIRIPQTPPPPPLPPGSPSPSPSRIASVLPLDTGSVQLLVVDEAPTGQTAIEVSTDLQHWQRVDQTQASGGMSVHVDGDANENLQRFYRLVPVAP